MNDTTQKQPEQPAPAAPRRRPIVDHKINDLNNAITLIAVGLPTEGGANHTYEMTLERPAPEPMDSDPIQKLVIPFQQGPTTESGFNGFTDDVLIAIVIDRLRGFQEGPFRCRENACALTRIEEGAAWLRQRSRDRIARGVYGTNAP